jgi:hypothetical protein
VNDDDVEDMLRKIGGTGPTDLAKAADRLNKILDQVRGGIAIIHTEIAKREQEHEVLRRQIDQVKRENHARALADEIEPALPLKPPTHQPPLLLQ